MERSGLRSLALAWISSHEHVHRSDLDGTKSKFMALRMCLFIGRHGYDGRDHRPLAIALADSDRDRIAFLRKHDDGSILGLLAPQDLILPPQLNSRWILTRVDRLFNYGAGELFKKGNSDYVQKH